MGRPASWAETAARARTADDELDACQTTKPANPGLSCPLLYALRHQRASAPSKRGQICWAVVHARGMLERNAVGRSN